jgi:hypothetical protein
MFIGSSMPRILLKVNSRMKRMCTHQLDLSNGVLSAPSRDRMQKNFPREVDVSTNHIGAQKPFGVSSFVVMVLDV